MGRWPGLMNEELAHREIYTMIQIPASIRQLALLRKGEVLRNARVNAQNEMIKLGITPESEFFAFFSEFNASVLFSTSSYEELMDVSEPTPQIAAGTTFVREVWEIPSEFICLTSCEGEGCYLYSTKSNAVYDFSLAEWDEFMRNPVARWKSFFDFIEWYLSPKVEDV
jgi:hypothetical protein